MERVGVERVGCEKTEVSFASAVRRRVPGVEGKKKELPNHVGMGTGLNTYLPDTKVSALADLFF